MRGTLAERVVPGFRLRWLLVFCAFGGLGLAPAVRAQAGPAGPAPRQRALEDATALVEAQLEAARREPRRRAAHLGLAAEQAASLGSAPGTDDPQALRGAWTRLANAVARARLRRGRPEAAVSLLSASARTRPAPRTDLAFGEALLGAYRPEEAVLAVRRALSGSARPKLAPPERARALRILARAELMVGGYEAAQRDAAASRAIEWTNPHGRALQRFAARRAGLRTSDLPAVRTARHEVRTDLGPKVLAAVAARLQELEPELIRLLPLPAGPRSSRRTRVYALSPARFAQVSPGGDAGASAFYHRDERAIYLAYASAPRARRQLGHEALHAHLHRLVDEPPVWLEEGLADYVAMLPAAAGHAPRRHPIRLRDAQVAARGGRRPALGDLVDLDRRALYGDEGLAHVFPFCWAWVYALREGESGALRGVLDRYLSAVLCGASGGEALSRATHGIDPARLDRALRALLAHQAG